MIKKIFSHIFSIALFLLFVIGTIALTTNYINDYHLLTAEKAEGMIVEKVAMKGLYLKPSYFARVETQSGLEENRLSRISFKQMEEREIGDTIEGYITPAGDFWTIRDYLSDSIFYILGILTFGFLSFVLGITIISEIPIVDRVLEKTFLGRTSNGSGWKVFLALMVVVSTYFSYLLLFNLFHATIPVFQTKTDAVIIEKDSYITYRKHEDSKFELTLEYHDTEGEQYTTIKEVTTPTYNKFSVGEYITINYRDNNPHDIFISHKSFGDIMLTLIYAKFFVLLICLVVVLVVIVYFFIKWWKRKKVS